jgi:hypothetical protein
MKRRLWLLPLQLNMLIIPMCALFLLLSAPAWADLTRDDAAVAAQRHNSGRVLSVDKFESAPRSSWRVKMVTPQGEVRVMLIDPARGGAPPQPATRQPVAN